VEQVVVTHLGSSMWVYKVVDMNYNRRGGTKVMSVVEVILSSNRRADGISPLLL
jgi:hypothetical protein